MKLPIILTFYIISTSTLIFSRKLRRVSKREEETLDKQHRNAVCCAKNMRCCVKPQQPPPIEVRAVLARCPNIKAEKDSTLTRFLNKPVISANEHSIKSFQGFDEDEPLTQSRVTQCRRKVLMTLKMHHNGEVNTKSQYIVIDHVFDPLSERSVRLLNPYVIKLRQEQVSKSFYLKFVDYVNSEAFEKIYNKHDGNYTGCYADKGRSTCGVVKYDGKIIPFSQGFCCSCDAAKNAEKQPDSVNAKNEAIISYSDPAYLLDRVQCPRNHLKEDNSSTPATTLKPSGAKSGESPCVANLLGEGNSTSSPKRWSYTMYSRKVEISTPSTPASHKYLKSGFKRKRHDSDGENALKSINLNLNPAMKNDNQDLKALGPKDLIVNSKIKKDTLDPDEEADLEMRDSSGAPVLKIKEFDLENNRFDVSKNPGSKDLKGKSSLSEEHGINQKSGLQSKDFVSESSINNKQHRVNEKSGIGLKDLESESSVKNEEHGVNETSEFGLSDLEIESSNKNGLIEKTGLQSKDLNLESSIKNDELGVDEKSRLALQDLYTEPSSKNDKHGVDEELGFETKGLKSSTMNKKLGVNQESGLKSKDFETKSSIKNEKHDGDKYLGFEIKDVESVLNIKDADVESGKEIGLKTQGVNSNEEEISTNTDNYSNEEYEGKLGNDDESSINKNSDFNQQSEAKENNLVNLPLYLKQTPYLGHVASGSNVESGNNKATKTESSVKEDKLGYGGESGQNKDTHSNVEFELNEEEMYPGKNKDMKSNEESIGKEYGLEIKNDGDLNEKFEESALENKNHDYTNRNFKESDQISGEYEESGLQIDHMGKNYKESGSDSNNLDRINKNDEESKKGVLNSVKINKADDDLELKVIIHNDEPNLAKRKNKESGLKSKHEEQRFNNRNKEPNFIDEEIEESNKFGGKMEESGNRQNLYADRENSLKNNRDKIGLKDKYEESSVKSETGDSSFRNRNSESYLSTVKSNEFSLKSKYEESSLKSKYEESNLKRDIELTESSLKSKYEESNLKRETGKSNLKTRRNENNSPKTRNEEVMLDLKRETGISNLKIKGNVNNPPKTRNEELMLGLKREREESTFRKRKNEESGLTTNLQETSRNREINKEPTVKSIYKESSTQKENKQSSLKRENDESNSNKRTNQETCLKNKDEESSLKNKNKESDLKNQNKESITKNKFEDLSLRNEIDETASMKRQNQESASKIKHLDFNVNGENEKSSLVKENKESILDDKKIKGSTSNPVNTQSHLKAKNEESNNGNKNGDSELNIRNEGANSEGKNGEMNLNSEHAETSKNGDSNLINKHAETSKNGESNLKSKEGSGLKSNDLKSNLKSNNEESNIKQKKSKTTSKKSDTIDDDKSESNNIEMKSKRDQETPNRLEAYYKKLQLNSRKKDKAYIDDVKKAHQSSEAYINQIKSTFGEDDIFAQRLIRKIRQTFPSGIQKRGRQNCADRYTPPGLDPEHYHESAHCLRFSDVWYGIYKLGDPFVEQSIYVNIYERFETETNPDKWREITNQTLHLGNRNPVYEDEVPTISITMSTETSNETTDEYSNLHSKRILIPEGIKHCDVQKYPEMKNGAEEYLVVNPEQIALEGDQCDRIGVGFEAFFKQPLRCGVPRSTCLHNQPKQLWRHDKALEKKSQKGCYFLKYHANITRDPILINHTTGEKYLDVEYRGEHVTTVDIEVKADFNAIIRQQTRAVVSEVYVDSTCDKITTIMVKIINSGLISNKFLVQLSDFPLEIPSEFSRIKSKLTLISPQNQHIFTLEVRHILPSELLFCSIEVLNSNHELVALRRIRIQKYDRCICTWHCLCACVASSAGLKCNPMSLEHYHAAGFQGSLPIVTYMVHFTFLDDLLSVVFYFALFLLVVLLLMGLLKALLARCFPFIGLWGLTVLLDLPKQMKQYYEPELKKDAVVYDRDGWAIHPKTKKRVRNISRSTEFCTNLVFFFIYPLAGCLLIFRRLCCSYYTKKHKGSTEKPVQRKMSKSESDKSKSYKTNSSQSDGASGTDSENGKKKSKSDRSNTSSSPSKFKKEPTTVARLTVNNLETRRKKSGSWIAGKKKKNSNSGQKICDCNLPKYSDSDDKILSSIDSTSTSKLPRRHRDRKYSASLSQSQSYSHSRSKCGKSPKSSCSSRTSHSSSSNRGVSSSRASKSSKKTTTPTTSTVSEKKRKRTAFVLPEKEKKGKCAGICEKQKRPKSM